VLQNDPKRLEKEFQNAKTNLSNLKAELTQLENNLEFFSNSSSENPLYKNVEKQIKSCQNKIDQVQQQYISLKQIKNALDKQARQAQEQEENADQDSSGEET
jgi:phage shock protein A